MTTTLQNRPEPDDAVTILRRLEPVLRDVLSEQKRMGADQARLADEQNRLADEQKRLVEEQKRVAEEQKRLADEQKRVALEMHYLATEQKRQGDEQRRQAEEQRRHIEILAEIRGKISQIPTSWQMMVAIVAIVFATIGGLRVGTLSF